MNDECRMSNFEFRSEDNEGETENRRHGIYRIPK